MVLPKEIDDNEILVRFIFLDLFKNKEKKIEKLNRKEVFFDNRGGVSLQRGNYCNENNCKKYGCKITSKIFSGFVVFTKEDFDLTVKEYQELRPKFESKIIFSPLDADGDYLQIVENVSINDVGNPTHADLKYINPAIKIEEQTPNISIRAFSHLLSIKSKILIDNNDCRFNYSGLPFT